MARSVMIMHLRKYFMVCIFNLRQIISSIAKRSNARASSNSSNSILFIIPHICTTYANSKSLMSRLPKIVFALFISISYQITTIVLEIIVAIAAMLSHRFVFQKYVTSRLQLLVTQNYWYKNFSEIIIYWKNFLLLLFVVLLFK